MISYNRVTLMVDVRHFADQIRHEGEAEVIRVHIGGE